jgi:hypothetical protein
MKKSFIYFLLPALLYMAVSCNKFADNINVNPNLPTNPSNAQLLTSAINYLPVMLESTQGSLYVQHWSEKPFPDNSRYLTVNFDFYGIYAGPLQNLQNILTTATFNVNDGSAANQLAVARILRAFYYWHMTDRWGDIPYSEALKGKDNFTPKYDTQKDIYYDLLKELKEAAAQIDNGNSVTGDILYSGNMANWRRFAQSMRMLVALRLSKVDATKGQAEFADAYAAGAFTDNSQNAAFVHLSDANNQNYWYFVTNAKGQNRPWYWASKTIVDYMNPLGDPRLKIFADTTATGTYVGVPYGLDANTVAAIPSASVSFIGVHTRTQNAPCYITTYAQVLLAVAEADKIGWLAGGDVDAALKYKAAIEASVRQWNRISFKAYNDKVDAQIEKQPYKADDLGDTTGLAAYMLRPEIVYSPTNALSQIGYQRWVHLYMNGYEAWAEWRRTGFPVLTPAPNNGGTAIPRRQAYPVKEQNINGTNYKAAIAQQAQLGGADDLKGRVWWDK